MTTSTLTLPALIIPHDPELEGLLNQLGIATFPSKTSSFSFLTEQACQKVALYSTSGLLNRYS